MNQTLSQRLINRAAKLNGCPPDERFQEDLSYLLVYPHFQEADGWRQFVDSELQDDWGNLDEVTKLAIYVTALKVYMAEILKLPELPVTIPYHGSRGPNHRLRAK